MEKNITIKGARENNLKNVNVTIPKDALVVFTGLSGSGKSTLAFDTLYAEGQRRYMESLSSYARQFLGNYEKPDVDVIDDLSPSIAIDQKSVSHNPRSTVGTVTEIYDYFSPLLKKEETNSIRNIWFRAEGTLGRLEDRDQRRLIKALAVILMINDFDRLSPSCENLSLSLR